MKKISIYNVNKNPIGCGGMGNVYLGYDPQGNKVAIKEMRSELITDSNIRDRFIQEINLMNEFDHSNIVKMYGSFCESSNLYMVMEYIEGYTLEELIREQGCVTENEALKIMDQVLEAMQYVHNYNVIHRDLKPSNIMIRKDNGKICLLDFGIAKDMKSKGLTSGMLTIGTNGYMSPEQAEGITIDSRTDIYSLGCVLYYILTGTHAIEEKKNAHETQIAVLNNNIKDIKSLNPSLSDFIAEVQRKATQKDMTKRYQSCREFQLELFGKKTISPSLVNRISIGRGDCDIKINDPRNKVSSYHADVEMILLSEYISYIYYDKSTNGSLVNGQKLHNSHIEVYRQSVDTKKKELFAERKPEIFLACLPEYLLDWDEVIEILNIKRGEETQIEKKEKNEIKNESNNTNKITPPLTSSTPVEENAVLWLIAIYIFAIMGGLLGIALGINVYKSKIYLPDGRKFHKYKKTHRQLALLGALLSIVSLVIWNILLAN